MLTDGWYSCCDDAAHNPLSTAIEHEHASTELCYRACVIEYFSLFNVLMCLRSEVYKKNVGSSVLVPLPCSVTRFIF